MSTGDADDSGWCQLVSECAQAYQAETQLGILIALPAETSGLVRGVPRPGQVASSTVSGACLLISGAGDDRARDGVRALAARGLGRVLNIGFAGGLHECWQAGALCMPERVCTREGSIVLSGGAWWRSVREHLQRGRQQPRAGSLYSAPEVLATPLQRLAARQAWQADVVDMEAYGIASEARARGMELVVLKVVLDQWDSYLPPCVFRHTDPWGRPKWLEFVPELLYHPGQYLSLWRLLLALRLARQRLRRLASALAEPGLDGALC